MIIQTIISSHLKLGCCVTLSHNIMTKLHVTDRLSLSTVRY